MSDNSVAQGVGSAVETPRRGFAMMLLIVSSVGISFGGLVLRSMETADAWQINFYRSLSLIAAIAIILAYRYRAQAVQKVRGIGWPGLWAGALLSCAGISFLQAITNTTIANTLFTLGAIPFITALLAFVFLKESIRRATLITMVFAAAGIVIMVAEGIGTGSFYGNAMAFLTALGFAGFAVIVRRNRQVDMLPALMVSGIIITAVSAIVRWGELEISVHDILLCILWGGVMSGFGNAMFVAASRHLVAAELTLFMLLEFALGPLWVWLFINEVPGHWTILGGALVIFAVVLRALIELSQARGPKLRRGRPSPM